MNSLNLDGVLLIIVAIAAFSGWALIELLLWAFSFINITFGA